MFNEVLDSEDIVVCGRFFFNDPPINNETEMLYIGSVLWGNHIHPTISTFLSFLYLTGEKSFGEIEIITKFLDDAYKHDIEN